MKVFSKGNTASIKEMIRQHDIILGVIIVVVCISALLLNQMISTKYNKILSANLYLNNYRTALDSLYGSLDQVVGNNELDIEDFDNRISKLQSTVGDFSNNIDYRDMWRYTTDIAHMTDAFIENVECVERLSVQGYHDAAIPIFEECNHMYNLIRDEYDDYNRKIVEINERERAVAEKFSRTLLIMEGVLAILVILLSIKLITRFIGHAVRPIEELSKKVSATSVNRDKLEQLPENDSGVIEVNELRDSYNIFIRRINDQIEKISRTNELERQLLEEEAKSLRTTNLLKVTEIKALQNRINPHFLFNSLNMITGTAYIEGAEETTNLMELLGSYLRYNLDKFDKMVTLKEEVENVRDYMEIQKVRMGDRFTYEIFADENCEDTLMPCLTLQPMVENSIKHGLHNCVEGGIIEVRCTRENDRVLIAVYDNGTGIEEEKLEELRKALDTNPFEDNQSSDSIGVRNVFARLSLYYDNDIEVSISSDGETFTKFEMNIPHKTEG